MLVFHITLMRTYSLGSVMHMRVIQKDSVRAVSTYVDAFSKEKASSSSGLILRTRAKGPSLELVHFEFLKTSYNHLEIILKSSTFNQIQPENPSLKM